MPLKDIHEYIDTTFSPQSRPQYRTVLEQIQSGNMPFYHRKIGKKWYIDPERDEDQEDIELKAQELINMVRQ